MRRTTPKPKTLNSRFRPEDLSEAGGDGAARITLSEAIAAVRTQLQTCDADLEAARLRLTGQELSGDLEAGGGLRLARMAKKVAAKLETCATALKNGSGQTGESDSPELDP